MLQFFQKKWLKFGLLGLTFLTAMALAGCSDGGSDSSNPSTSPSVSPSPSPSTGQTGNINVTILNAKKTYSNNPLYYYITAYKNNDLQKSLDPFTVERDGSITKTLSQCASGTWEVVVTAKDTSPHYFGHTQVIVNANATANASITLTESLFPN